MSIPPVPDMIELLPTEGEPRQLFILLHGAGARAADMLPLATSLQTAFPAAAILLPEGFMPCDGDGSNRQWFSLRGLSDENRAERVAAALPLLQRLVQQQQARFGLQENTLALAGFSQGATLAMELGAAHDGMVGRILAFSGRYASLPSGPTDRTTLHLFHGSLDAVTPIEQMKETFTHLMNLQSDATLDIATGVGHELHPALTAQAVVRLQTCVPLRMWRQAL